MHPKMRPGYRKCGDSNVAAGRESGQEAWYAFIAPRFSQRAVLDVGCGLGVGLEILRSGGARATGQDLDPRLQQDGVIISPIHLIPTNAYECVTCIDVIEHVEQDNEFVGELVRIASKSVFITTPLSILSRPLWPFHVREYTFPQFRELVEPYGRCQFFKGTSSGEAVYPVAKVQWFSRFAAFLNHPLTNVPARLLNRVLPARWRNMGHQAVLISV